MKNRYKAEDFVMHEDMLIITNEEEVMISEKNDMVVCLEPEQAANFDNWI